ncbi:hypothetical protein JYU34_003026 [Plutella xylostella]|uniref:Uncharacterized protein n=1 Tax=Plutella xylostella TaxID=51655 RepID=A0ABQ7QZ13_PLUXY|nr:hypothetical protein JYU34_003026 [Plutella xylostella]
MFVFIRVVPCLVPGAGGRGRGGCGGGDACSIHTVAASMIHARPPRSPGADIVPQCDVGNNR